MSRPALPPTLSVSVLLLFASACQDQPAAPGTGDPDAPQFLTVPYAVFTQVTAGALHTCALRNDGVAICWGANGAGQAPASKAAAAGRFVQLSAGGAHTCSLRDDGVVECWGYNILGQAPAIKTPAAGKFILVSAGKEHTCAERDDFVLECWGSNGFGQANATFTPRQGFIDVSSSNNGNCGVTVSPGVIDCWGQDALGPIVAASPHAYLQVDVRPYFADGGLCALRTDGVVECMGFSGSGVQSRTLRTAGSGSFTNVTVGSVFSSPFACARRTDGVVECWGTNHLGQAPATKTAVTGSFTRVSAGDEHACALRTDGAVECWGSNRLGQAPPVYSVTILPTATFTAPAAADEGSDFVISITDGQVPGGFDGSPYRYFLDCGGLSGSQETTMRTCRAFEGPASLHIIGVVRDRDGDQGIYQAHVTVNNVAPTVNPFAGAELLITEPYAATGTFSDPGLDTHTGTVAYGDGPAAALALTGTTFSLDHRYMVSGVFTVVVNVTDDDGATGSQHATVTVISIEAFTRTLQAEIDGLVGAGTLSAADGRALNSRLDRMLRAVAGGHYNAAASQIRGFKNLVVRLVEDGVLTPAQGDSLFASAARIEAAIAALR